MHTLKTHTTLPLALGLLLLGTACGAGDPPSETELTQSQSALTTAQERILGFEAASDWTATSGVLSNSSSAVQGSSALAVSNAGYVELVSPTLSSLGPLADKLRLQVRIPSPAPNPWWHGIVTVRVNAPSKGLYSAIVGDYYLGSAVPGQYHNVEMPIPAYIASALSGTYNDLTVRVVLNVPYSNTPYLVDGLNLTGAVTEPDLPDPPSGPTRALMLVDSRLYAYLGASLEEYRAKAAARRGFPIELRHDEQYDDWTHTQIKEHIKAARTTTPSLEGVLFVGNIKLPSFYKTRNDIVLTRLASRYYEDLDGQFGKYYQAGALDPVCNPNTPWNTLCVVSPRADGGTGPVTVLPHDFDQVAEGPNPGPELWASFMPVGSATGNNTYAEFAQQLTPYLRKVISFYDGALTSNGRLYAVGNDKGEIFEEAWEAFGPENIDLYGRSGPNGESGAACYQGGRNLCYVRWDLASYPTYADFHNAYQSLPWSAEGWQDPNLYTAHMNESLYDVADVTIHSNEYGSLISTETAASLQNAGLLVASSGCGVMGYRQPNAPSTTQVDTAAAVDQNVMVAYLYGNSKALAALGTAAWRGHYANHPLIYREMKVKSAYLGAAHFARMRRHYAQSTTSDVLRELGSDMLLGDPFMDLK